MNAGASKACKIVNGVGSTHRAAHFPGGGVNFGPSFVAFFLRKNPLRIIYSTNYKFFLFFLNFEISKFVAKCRQVWIKMLIKIQPDATVCRYLFTAKSFYMFRVSQHPSSGVLKTLTATSGTGHNTGTATSLQRGR